MVYVLARHCVAALHVARCSGDRGRCWFVSCWGPLGQLSGLACSVSQSACQTTQSSTACHQCRQVCSACPRRRAERSKTETHRVKQLAWQSSTPHAGGIRPASYARRNPCWGWGTLHLQASQIDDSEVHAGSPAGQSQQTKFCLTASFGGCFTVWQRHAYYKSRAPRLFA